MLFNQSVENEIIEFKMRKWMQKFENTSSSNSILPTVFLSTLAWFNVTMDGESSETRMTIDGVLKNVDVKKVDHLLILMKHHCEIAEKPGYREHFTLLHFDFQDPMWRQYNLLVHNTGTKSLEDAKIMARRVYKELSELYAPMDVDVNQVNVELYPKICPQQEPNSLNSGMYVLYFMYWVMNFGYEFQNQETVMEKVRTECVQVVYEILQDERSCWKKED
ncbi:hypothetical protein C5167_034194 [Papaver somniferum]|uniref:Uncharacterized protein n=1 Tax=Papaver somniferum TaxID=3469 RepID=A0A4Y7KFA1_PAPSO|nr:hypothetical protein C5167_034194 [Papaver somniferum]